MFEIIETIHIYQFFLYTLIRLINRNKTDKQTKSRNVKTWIDLKL